MNPQPDNRTPPEPPQLRKEDTARLRFIKRLHGYEEAAFVHMLRSEQTEELLELKRVALNAQWFEVAAKLAKAIKDRTPARPTPEPKVQVTPTAADHALARKLLSNCSYGYVNEQKAKAAKLIATHVASAVEAARAEVAKHCDVKNDEYAKLMSDQAIEITQLQAELARVREESEGHERMRFYWGDRTEKAEAQLTTERAEPASTKRDLVDLKSAYAAAIYRLQELGEKTIVIPVDTALDKERTAHATTKEMLQHYIDYADGQNLMSDFSTAKEMRAALDQARADVADLAWQVTRAVENHTAACNRAEKAESSLAALVELAKKLRDTVDYWYHHAAGLRSLH